MNNEFLAKLIANRDAICARHMALIAAGDAFAAEDLYADVQFAIRAAHDAMMER